MCLLSSLTTQDFVETLGNPDEPTSSDESLEEPLPSTSQTAVIEALNLSCDDFPINKSSIQRIRTQNRKDRTESIKSDFQNNLPETVTVHWDGKLLPGLDVRSSKEERLPILISLGEKEQLLAAPKLERSLRYFNLIKFD
ncbi:hypothetical protein QE152_g15616 [Popillia japonica]|uniref:Uncharacterized protein n=1 Tax=Popillia japonica TaxID=7064 RepID=A0AAW1L4Z2_POPJA